MKTNYWLILGTMIATGAVAQVNTNTLPAIPAPATITAPAVTEAPSAPAPAPKKAPVKKKAVKKISEPTVSLTAGTATVLSENLNLRGQAGLKGEVVGHLKKGDSVTVISQINLDKHALDEPAQWAKVALPSGTKVWVSAHFVDAATKVVTSKKLNLRAGPGENYSVLGVLEKGASVNEISTKNGWIEIEAPASACAFAAAMYLKQEAPAVVVAPVVVPPPQPAVVPEPAPVVAQPAPVEPAVEPAAVAAVDTNPPPPRVVSHQGFVRSSVSPVAPTPYELFNQESGVTVNYLHSTAAELDLSRYVGLEIIATGEEGMAPRWAATPVLTIQKIYVVSDQREATKRVTSPRATQTGSPRGYKRN